MLQANGLQIYGAGRKLRKSPHPGRGQEAILDISEDISGISETRMPLVFVLAPELESACYPSMVTFRRNRFKRPLRIIVRIGDSAKLN